MGGQGPRVVGVLACQGDFAAHGRALDRLGAAWREVRGLGDLEGVEDVILPGGESTTQLKMVLGEGMGEALRQRAAAGGAMFGTCAGAILMAREVARPAQPSLGLLDIRVERNAYGRQRESFVDRGSLRGGGEPLEMVFIRAPIITDLGEGVEVLARHEDRPVLVRQGKRMAACFHPELTEDLRVQEMFLELMKGP